MYTIEKSLNKLSKNQPTYFLDSKEQRELERKIKKNYCNKFYPYPDSEKVIYYKDKLPEVVLYEVVCKAELRHQDILGTMYALNIAKEMFGDIIIDNGHYYIYILKLFQNYFEMNFCKVKNVRVELKKLELDYLSNYRRKYEEIEIIVSSERVDTIIARIINTSRSMIKDKVIEKEILVNDELLKNLSYNLKENDTFSIRKIGKFKYVGIVKTTKSNNYIVKVLRYI